MLWSQKQCGVRHIASSSVVGICSPAPIGFGDGVAPDLVDKVHDHVVLLDPETVEVFPHSHGQLLLALPPVLLLPGHRGGLQPDASGS